MSERLTDVLGEENRPFLEIIRFVIYGVFMYLNIDSDIIFILSILMVADIIFGIAKALRLGIKLKPNILLWGFVSKIGLLTIPMIVALIGKVIGKDFVWTVDLTIKMLVVNEGFSVIANILSIRSNKNVENFDFITLMVNSARDYVVNKIKNHFKSDE